MLNKCTHFNCFLAGVQSFDTCNTSKGFQLDTSPVPYPADGPFAAGDPEPRVSYTYNVPQAQDSTPVYLACAASGHCEAGQEISLAIIPEYAELNPDDSGLLVHWRKCVNDLRRN